MQIKKHIALLLAFFLLISNSGLAFNVHYCGEKIAAISSVFSDEEVCEMLIKEEKSSELNILQTKADEMTRKLMMKDLSDLGSFPTVQSHLNKLIDLGWIERRDDETDKRAVLLVVAPRARQALHAISKGLHEWYEIIGRRMTSFIAQISAWTMFLEQAIPLCMI
jgi:predicted transcriptional regulator